MKHEQRRVNFSRAPCALPSYKGWGRKCTRSRVRGRRLNGRHRCPRANNYNWLFSLGAACTRNHAPWTRNPLVEIWPPSVWTMDYARDLPMAVGRAGLDVEEGRGTVTVKWPSE